MMTKLKWIWFIQIVFTFISCENAEDENDQNSNNTDFNPSKNLQLIFQTGFEGIQNIAPFGNSGTEKITGSDPDLPKSNWDELQKTGDIKKINIYYSGGDASKRYTQIVNDPVNPNNKVLMFCLNDSWFDPNGENKGRVQFEFYNINPAMRELYQSVRVFLSEDFNALKSYPHSIKWCTLSEFWNNEWWGNHTYGFRITLGIGKPDAKSNDLNFIINSEDDGMKEVWNADNVNIKVPVGKWFTMEYYFKEGNNQTGRFYMAITPDGEEKQVVCDVHNFTHMTKEPNPNGLTGYNPLKLYTSDKLIQYVIYQSKTLKVYWDDLKVWRD